MDTSLDPKCCAHPAELIPVCAVLLAVSFDGPHGRIKKSREIIRRDALITPAAPPPCCAPAALNPALLPAMQCHDSVDTEIRIEVHACT